LIIDDNKGDLELIRELLIAEGMDFEVLWAETGSEALEIVEERRPEIVLLDVRLPGMDGYEVCGKLKACGVKNIYIIMMTSSMDVYDQQKADACGADDICLKLHGAIVSALLRVKKVKAHGKTVGEQISIALVEDNPGDQALMKAVLDSSGIGYKLFVLDRPDKVVEFVVCADPKLILMDIMMPDLSGGDAVRLLRKDNRTKNIPVVFLTGILGRRESDPVKGINIEGELYPVIPKPVGLETLMELLKRYT